MVSQWLSGWKLIHYGLISQIGINPTPRLRCFIVDISSELCLWSCLNPCLKKLAPRVLTEHQIHVEDQQISLLHIHILDKNPNKTKNIFKKNNNGSSQLFLCSFFKVYSHKNVSNTALA